MFDVNSANPAYSVPDLLAVILLGVIGGIFGSLYNYLVDKVLRTYSIINEYAQEILFILITVSHPNKHRHTQRHPCRQTHTHNIVVHICC